MAENNSYELGFLFDNDGVVLDTEQALVGINTEMLRPYGVEFDPSSRKHFSGKPDIPGLKVLIDVHGLNGKVTPEELSQARKGKLDQWYTESADLVSGVTTYLEGLRKAFPNAKISIASGTDPERFAMADKKRDITGMFGGKVCLSRNCVSNHKPAPDIFVYAAGTIGVPINKCVVWEDSPLGLAAAYNAGVRKNIGFTRTLPKKDLLKATEEALQTKLTEGDEILFIDEFNEDSLRATIDYLKK